MLLLLIQYICIYTLFASKQDPNSPAMNNHVKIENLDATLLQLKGEGKSLLLSAKYVRDKYALPLPEALDIILGSAVWKNKQGDFTSDAGQEFSGGRAQDSDIHASVNEVNNSASQAPREENKDRPVLAGSFFSAQKLKKANPSKLLKKFLSWVKQWPTKTS